MMARKKFRNDLQLLLRRELQTCLYINIAAIVIMLSIFNLSVKQKSKVTVLGATTDNSYWEELVQKHPTYRDAWVELGRMDMVEEIDPNYN